MHTTLGYFIVSTVSSIKRSLRLGTYSAVEDADAGAWRAVIASLSKSVSLMARCLRKYFLNRKEGKVGRTRRYPSRSSLSPGISRRKDANSDVGPRNTQVPKEPLA